MQAFVWTGGRCREKEREIVPTLLVPPYDRATCLEAWAEPTLDKGSVFAMVYGVREWIEEVTGGSCPSTQP